MFVGLDVHKATISVAIARGERGGEVRHWGTIPNRADHVRKLAEKLGGEGRSPHFCYEAGPCGYGIHRQLVEMGHDCMVVALSLIPVKAGDRVKTDRRDALVLAKLHRAGELTAVWVPDEAHEAMRDLVRARATAVRVTGQARPASAGLPAPARSDLSGQEGLERPIGAGCRRSGSSTRRNRSCSRTTSMPTCAEVNLPWFGGRFEMGLRT